MKTKKKDLQLPNDLKKDSFKRSHNRGMSFSSVHITNLSQKSVS